ncbi:uncharacterized protein LOC127810010 [Diospyros lotus]|uniref:uncharacterized protein LOC127810010 n=1 Tax=Diospyros lotus TaxID=55363 RepID=UPI002250D75F|nr:uncharacterized protein LOC127810010 [Diospyros lotus]
MVGGGVGECDSGENGGKAYDGWGQGAALPPLETVGPLCGDSAEQDRRRGRERDSREFFSAHREDLSSEEVAMLEDWSCPKCRGICSCSVCMKKRGHRPTGILVHTAKENGFSSVSELHHVKGHESFGSDNNVKAVDASSGKLAASNNVLDLKEGEPEHILLELIHGGHGAKLFNCNFKTRQEFLAACSTELCLQTPFCVEKTEAGRVWLGS